MTLEKAGAKGKSGDKREILNRRIAFLTDAHAMMVEHWLTVAQNTKIDIQRVRRTVNEYLTELDSIKERDNIPDLAQRHKIAALMAMAIVRNKPLVDCVRGDFEGIDNLGPSRFNELFAVYHGVAICGEGHADQAKQLISSPHFNAWVDNFARSFERSLLSQEAVIQVFETLCLGFFRDNLSHG